MRNGGGHLFEFDLHVGFAVFRCRERGKKPTHEMDKMAERLFVLQVFGTEDTDLTFFSLYFLEQNKILSTKWRRVLI